jgi:hypothetical protein
MAGSGRINGGASFDGSTQYISVPQIIATNTTVEHWVYFTGTTNFVVTADTGWNSTDGFATVITAGQHAFVKHAEAAAYSGTNSALNTWEHVVWTVDTDNKARLYINGSLSYTDTDTQAIITQTHGGSLGSRLDVSGNPFRYFPGTLDEARISNIARSADWIKTEYNNQSSPSTFYAISSSGNEAYTYRRSVTIDHTKVPTNQSNFPLLISGTFPYLAGVANGGNVQNSNGYDIVFTSDAECATKLDFEVETYNASTGAVNYWVKVPTISHTSDTPIYMCYGNASITTDQSNKTGVWDANYKGVWHLPNGTSLTVNDSTASGNNGTNHSATAVSGKVDGAANCDGSSQSISVPQIIATNTTVEHWMYRTASADFRIMADAGWNSTDGFCTVLNSDQHAFVKHARAVAYTTISSPLNTWEHVVWTVDTDNKARLYINGVLSYTDTDTQAIISQTHGGSLGSRLDVSGNPFRYFPGTLDEVRISNVARSADWITTEYNNQSSPATFYVISSSPLASAPRIGDITTAGLYDARNASVDTNGTSGGSPGILTRMLFDVASVVHVSGIGGPSLTFMNVMGQYGWLEGATPQTTVPPQGASVKHPEAGS